MESKLAEKSKDMAVNLGDILLFVLVIFVIVHVGIALIANILSPDWLSVYKKSINQNIRLNVGLPSAAVGAYGVVSLLLHAFPPEKQSGTIKLKFFGLEFTGPAGPITLWLACFLSIVAAMTWF